MSAQDTTLDPRLAGLKDGDTVRLARGFEVDVYEFVGRRGDIAILFDSQDNAAFTVRASAILWPPTPTAEPGRRYEMANRACIGVVYERIGTHDGRLWNGAYVAPYVPMSADWIKVEEGE